MTFPISGKPVTMFSLDGGAVHSSERIGTGRQCDNYANYYESLLGHALGYIKTQRAAPVREPSMLERITH